MVREFLLKKTMSHLEARRKFFIRGAKQDYFETIQFKHCWLALQFVVAHQQVFSGDNFDP